MNAEKHVAEPATGSGDPARHLGRIAEQTGLDTGDEKADCSDSVPVFESIKPTFTRKTGSGRRAGPAG